MITLIITCHNQHRFLEQFFKIQENYLRGLVGTEFIVIDSTGEEILVPDNYRYFHIANNGPSYARNFGASKAINEWLIFCDADDIVNPFIFRQLPDLEVAGFDALFFDWKRAEDQMIENTAISCYDSVQSPVSFTISTITDQVVFLNKFFPVHAMLVKKAIWETVKFREEQWFIEDVRFYLEMALEPGTRMGICQAPEFTSFHRYFKNGISLSTSNNQAFWEGVAANYNFASTQKNLTKKQKFDLLKILLLSYHSVDRELQQILKRDCKTIWKYFFGTGKLIRNKNIFKIATTITRSFT